MLFEEWKTTKTSDLIARHLDIFHGRHGKIDGIRLVALFSQKIPEYAKLKTDPNNIHSACQITYNGMTGTIAEWGHKTGIPCDVIRARYAAGWKPENIFTKPVIKPGQNFADDEETKKQKRLLIEQMLITYKDAGYGFAGHKAVCVKFNLDICYDALIKKFKRFGLDYNKPSDMFDYHGKMKTLAELSELSGLSKHLLYDRLVRRNLLSDFSIDDLLKKDLPDISKERAAKKQVEMYEKLKPLFDLYLEKGGGTEGYEAVCEKFGYDADYGNLRRQFNKYVPEYKEYRQKCLDSQFHIEYNGQMLTPFEISKLTGIEKSLICSRLNDGWDIYDVVSTSAGFESDYEYRRNELSDQFRYWSEHGFSGFNDKFNTTYKNEGCVTSLFRKYFKHEYDDVVRSHKIMLTVDGKSYTIRELAEKTGNTIATCRERISRGCSVEEIMKPGKLVDANSPEYVERMRKILIPYFESYSRRGFAEVKKDFPDCEYKAGNALRNAFIRYIPDLYKPENNGAALRIKMGEQITIDGVTKAIGEWAREYDLSVGKIRQRLDYGITGKDLLKKEWLNANQVEYRGKTYNGYAELAREFGIDRSTLLNRLKRGMTIDEALSKPVRPKTKR